MPIGLGIAPQLRFESSKAMNGKCRIEATGMFRVTMHRLI